MQIPNVQGDALTELVKLDYKIRLFHADGVIDCAKQIGDEVVRVFVDPDGTIHPPRTHATMIASAELHGLALERGVTAE